MDINLKKKWTLLENMKKKLVLQFRKIDFEMLIKTIVQQYGLDTKFYECERGESRFRFDSVKRSTKSFGRFDIQASS